ncbi:hypothetical protein CHELA1G11_12863 [Hyphomicrobiales bacterium]|nr:hypothetical protein CHELA1G2_11446 [Hyphomicrobiales bacterium]CAH1667647.1 hypothetical protein CHELA1G11_12863 [Hyphomicrobiales bacterium]
MDLANAKVVRLVETRYTSEGAAKAIGDADKVAESQEKVSQSTGAVAEATDRTAKTILSAEGSYKRLLTSVDKQFRAQSQLASGQAALSRAIQQGVIDTREYDRVMALLATRYGGVKSSSTELVIANDNVAGSFARVVQAAQAAVPGLARFGGFVPSISGLAGGIAAVGTAALAAGTAIASAGDEFTRYGNLLQAAGVSAAELGARQQLLVDLALNTRTALEPTVTLYAGLSRSTQELGKSQAEVARATETINKAFKLGGVSAESAAGAILQLNQAMAAGALRGDELNSVLEGAPPLARLIAKEFEVGIGELKKLGEEGKLSATRVFDAIVKGSDDIDSSFRDSKVTMQDAATNGVTAFTDLGAALDRVLGISTRVAGAINSVAASVRNVAAAVRELPDGIELANIQGLDKQIQEYQSRAGNRAYANALSGGVDPITGTIIDGSREATDATKELIAQRDKLIEQRINRQVGVAPGVPDPAAQLVGIANDNIKRSIDGIGAQADAMDELGRSVDKSFAGISKLGEANRALDKSLQDATRNGLKPFDRAVSDAQKGLAERKKVAEEMAKSGVAQADINAYLAKSESVYAKEVSNASAAEAKRSKSNKDTVSSYDSLLQRTRDRIEELRLERQYVGQTSDAVMKLKLSHDLERAAKKSGTAVTEEMRREWDLLGDSLAGATRDLENTQRAYQDLQDAQKFLGDSLSSFVEDLVSGTGSLEDALKRLADTFLKSGLQALLTGEGPLAGILGASATEKGKQGGLLGYLMGNDVKLFRDTVAKGTEDGLKKAVGSTPGGAGGDAATNLFGVDGKMLMGGITALASLGAAYGGGLSSSSPTMGAATGALSGGVGALSLMAIPAIAAIPGIGPLLAVGGALLGGGLGFMGGSQSQKQRKEELKRQAEENYQQAKPQVAQLGQMFRGDELGNIQQQIQAGIDKLNELGPVLVNAGHVDELIALQKDYNTFVSRLKDEFRDDFTGTIEELRAGLGAQGPFKQASDAVKQFGDSAKSFIADTATSFGEGAWQIQNARDASIDYALSMLDQAKTLTEVQQSIQSINGTAAGLSKVLQDLGMSAEDAANAINQRVGAAMDRLRSAFTDGLERRLNEASDRGYINEISDQIAQYRKDLADAAALGLDGALAAKVFAAEAQQIVNGAELAGDAFNALVQQFPELAGVVKEFSQALADMGNDLAAIAQRQQGYYDRIFNAANDNSTLEGALKAFDRQAQREREAEMKAGGQAITDLELALAAERVKIVNDFAAKAKAAEQQAAEQAARAAQQKVDEAQRAVDDARADLQRAYEQQASTINATISRLEAFTSSIRKMRTDLRFDDSLSPYNDRQQQQEAQATFQELAAKAMAGDQTAMDQLADAARRYLEESKAYYGFNEVYARIFEEVQSTLEAVGSKAQSELDIARAQLAALDAQVSGLLTVNDSVLTVAAGIEKLNAAVAALAAAQAAQIGNGTGTPDQRTAYVTSLYQKYFGRQPDQAGLDFWVKSDLSTAQLDQAFADAKEAGAMRLGGIVGAYARGGLIGNGIFDVDSVIARYAGGGNIALAGGEYVMPANQTRANLPVLEAMRAGRAPANDDSAKEEIRALRALVEQLIAVSAQGHREVAAAVVENTSAVKEDTRKAGTAQIARQPGVRKAS